MEKLRLWDRQEYENENMWLAFKCYMERQPRSVSVASRSYRKIKNLKPNQKPQNAFNHWAQGRDHSGRTIPDGHTWVERAQAKDNFLQQEADIAELEAMRKKRADLVDLRWGMGGAMVKQAQDMLKVDLANSKWSKRDVVGLLAEGLKQMAESVGIETSTDEARPIADIVAEEKSLAAKRAVEQWRLDKYGSKEGGR